MNTAESAPAASEPAAAAGAPKESSTPAEAAAARVDAHCRSCHTPMMDIVTSATSGYCDRCAGKPRIATAPETYPLCLAELTFEQLQEQFHRPDIDRSASLAVARELRKRRGVE